MHPLDELVAQTVIFVPSLSCFIPRFSTYSKPQKDAEKSDPIL